MIIHVFQHVQFEGPAFLESIFKARGHDMTVTPIYRSGIPAHIDSCDMLVVLGGPMGVGDNARFPWLAAEKRAIEGAVSAGKKVLGICLGAQLIADVLGAVVRKNPYREIGWYPVQGDPSAPDSIIWKDMPSRFNAFHWHGDTFEIPQGAVRIGGSEACVNQGFIAGDRVVALQFHLESTPQSVGLLLENAADELDGGPYVASPEAITGSAGLFSESNSLMERLVCAFEKIP